MKNKIVFAFLNLKSEKGFSLVEVLITTGLASLILGGTLKVLTLSTQTSQVQKLSTVEKELQTTVARLLSEGSECRGNLNPTRLGGDKNQEGVGSLTNLVKYNQAGSADDIKLLSTQKLFNDQISLVKMELVREPGDKDSDPKAGVVKRNFIVYYKKKAGGHLSTLGGGRCDASNTSHCYFTQCRLNYQLENKDTQPRVQICEALNCLSLTGEDLLNTPCYTTDFEGENKEDKKQSVENRTHKGRTLVGCKKTSEIKTSHTTAFGYGAGNANATGFNNTFFGFKAGEHNTTGTGNTFFGYQAGGTLKSGDSNVFVGFKAGSNVHQGKKNTPDVWGKIAPLNYSTLAGAEAGQNLKGFNTVFLGAEAGKNNTHPRGGNLFLGRASGRDSKEGERHIFLGAYSGAGPENKGGTHNTFIGACSGYGVKTTGSGSKNNIFLGNFTGYNYDKSNKKNTSECVYEGFITPETKKHFEATLKKEQKKQISKSLGEENIFIGHGAGAGALTTDDNNIFMGFQAGFLNTTGKHNVFIGKEAGFHNTTADYNTFVGTRAGYYVWKGKDDKNLQKNGVNSRLNTFLGWESGYGCWKEKNKKCIDGASTGYKNVFIGPRAGYKNIRGNRNVFIGNRTGRMYTNSKTNVIVGAQAGRGRDSDKAENSRGQSIFGFRAGRHSKGEYNTFLGAGAGVFSKTGKHNIAVGLNAGAFSTTGHYNIFIGASEEFRGEEGGFGPSKERYFGVGPHKDDHSGSKSAGLTPKGNNQLNIGNLLIGKMPENESSSPRLDQLPGDSNGNPHPGLIVNGNLCVKDQIHYGAACKTSVHTELQQIQQDLDKAEAFFNGKISALKSQNRQIQEQINKTNNEIQRYNSM